jgi:carboxyl-terminal processing protease
MTFRTKFVVAIVSATIAIYALVGALIATRAQQPINDPGAQMRIFESVLQHIQNDYVDEPNMDKVRAGALRGLASGLDPYSTYLTPEQVKSYKSNGNGDQTSIGAELSQLGGYLYVVSPVKGSPAEKAGLQAGDIIEYIDAKATRDISLYDAKQLLAGAPGSEVKLRVIRAGSTPATLTVKRGAFKAQDAEARLEPGKIGVVQVHSLAQGQSAVVKSRLQELLKQGAQKIVLDLRGVAGGDLKEGVSIANFFIKEGTLAQTIGREGKTQKTFTAEAANFLFDGPAIVLIDGGTAGAAEVVASAFIGGKRGDVVGEKSFGAGAEQQLFTLRDGDGLLLTTVKWASGGGKPFLGEDRDKSGVSPTVEVKRPDTNKADPEDLAGSEENPTPGPENPDNRNDLQQNKPKPLQEDIQMKKALELLREKPATVLQKVA